MRSSIATLRLAFAGIAALLTQGASAQDEGISDLLGSGLPDCAIACTIPLLNITGMPSDNAICDVTDVACICQNEQFLTTSAACVQRQCTTTDALAVKNVTTQTCDTPARDATNKIVIVAAAFSSLSAFFVIQRFAVKIFSPDLLLGLDDWMVLLAALIQAPCAAIASVAGSKYGLGKDIWTLTPHQITQFGHYLYVYATIYMVNIPVCKLAFLLFYLRVFPAPRVRRILWATVGFVCVYALAFLFLHAFQCTPVSHYWHRWDGVHEGTCLNASHIVWAHAVISISLDFWNVAIPLYQLKGVSLDWKKKLGVGLMFSVGLFTTVISIVRLVDLVRHDWESTNQSWVKLDLAIWCTIEVNSAIICACLPAFRSLLVRIFPGLHLGMATHRDRTHEKVAEDFYTGNRDLGFGTISRSVAEKRGAAPVVPGAIAMSRTYKIETESVLPNRASGSTSTTADHALMHVPSLEGFSSASTLDGRRDTLDEVRRYTSEERRDTSEQPSSSHSQTRGHRSNPYGHRRQYSATTERFDRGDFGRRDTFDGRSTLDGASTIDGRRYS